MEIGFVSSQLREFSDVTAVLQSQSSPPSSPTAHAHNATSPAALRSPAIDHQRRRLCPTMHQLRLRWVALGLLVCLRSAVCRPTVTSTTQSPSISPSGGGGGECWESAMFTRTASESSWEYSFSDTASRTLAAQAILLVSVVRTKITQDLHQTTHVRFQVERVLKSTGDEDFDELTYETFQLVADIDHGVTQDMTSCKPKLRRGRHYVIYLGPKAPVGSASIVRHSNSTSGLSPSSPPPPSLTVSGFPVPSTDSLIKEIQRFVACRKCRE